MAKSKEELLERLKQTPGRWTMQDAEKLLTAYGWEKRKAKKVGAVWKRGPQTLTLPTPSQAHLKIPYVKRVLRMIEGG